MKPTTEEMLEFLYEEKKEEERSIRRDNIIKRWSLLRPNHWVHQYPMFVRSEQNIVKRVVWRFIKISTKHEVYFRQCDECGYKDYERYLLEWMHCPECKKKERMHHAKKTADALDKFYSGLSTQEKEAISLFTLTMLHV